MTINSLHFAGFFIIVFFVYYFPLKEKKEGQNILLLVSSYVFYGIANWKMIPLLLIATGIFYALGVLVEKYNKNEPRKAGALTTLGVCAGVGILLYFKYLNFFINSFTLLFTSLGLKVHPSAFKIIMPAGVSFFTFKLVSYCIEIYRGHMESEKDFVTFASYVAFFPTIMAGPIDRPDAFIPQLHKARQFNYRMAVDGCRQILWGAFKKMILSDNLALVADDVWGHISETSSINLILCIFIYTMQLYTDFSGYSDMSIGVGKLLGLNVTVNFKYPFYGRNIAELWRNYHISLTSWLTDYVFMPLNVAFRNLGKAGIIFAILINMLLIGLWHEANLTWAVFGLYNGVLFIPLILTGAFNRKKKLVPGVFGLPGAKDFGAMLLTFVLFSIGITITRAANVGEAVAYFKQIFEGIQMTRFSIKAIYGKPQILGVFILLILEWFSFTHRAEYAFSFIAAKTPRALHWAIAWGMALVIILAYINNAPRGFIYFDF